jgi:nicotinamidase-related amidase
MPTGWALPALRRKLCGTTSFSEGRDLKERHKSVTERTTMSSASQPPDDPSATAVVCVECQNGVLGPNPVLPALGADTGDLVINIGRLLTAARSSGVVAVIHATFEGLLGGDHLGSARIWRVLGPATEGWTRDSAPTQVIPELLGPDDLVVARHHGLYPTLDTELLPVLANLGVRTVVLAGVSLNLALPFTAGHMSQSGYRVVAPRDAVGGTPPAYADLAITHTMAMLATITTIEALTAEWASA